MKLGKFIEMLKQYPEDAEVKVGHRGIDDIGDVFKISLDNEGVIVSTAPGLVEEVYCEDKDTTMVSYNVDDTFTLYSMNTDDVVNGNYDDFKVMFHAIPNDIGEDISYKDRNLHFAGELRKFLEAFPDSTPVNIKCGDAHTGVIHEIRKVNVEYLTGVDPRDGDVYTECVDELFLEYGVPISGCEGGGSFPLTDNYPWYTSDEVELVIAEPIKKHFQDNNHQLSDEERKKCVDIVLAIKENLYKYYNFRYKLNGSWDSNGAFHPYDKTNYYKKPVHLIDGGG